MMNVGHCSICLGNFTASDMGVLRRCMHTFHRDCIGRAVRLRRECPLCRGEATMQDISTPILNTTAVPHNLTKEALDIALGYYDKIVVSTSSKAQLANNCAGSASSSSDQREQLRACLVNLLSTLDDRAEQKEETWQRLVDFIKMASIASIGGVLAFFCFLYWPMIAPLAGTLASTAWSLIVRLCGFVRSHFPEILGGICGLMEMWVIWKESSIIDEEEAEVARLAEEEQQQQAADWN